TVLQNSAKGNGKEIGIRAREASGKLTFLGFLFVIPEDAPLTGAKCRDGAISQEQQTRPGMKVSATTDFDRPDDLPLALSTYTWQSRDGTPGYTVRAFVASGELCGDLEFDSPQPISANDTAVKAILATYKLDPSYVPRFRDVLFYAQTLFEAESYRPSGEML